MKKLEAGLQKNALSYLLVLRLILLFAIFVVNLVPAFLGVRPRTYFIGTTVGIIPGSLVRAAVGAVAFAHLGVIAGPPEPPSAREQNPEEAVRGTKYLSPEAAPRDHLYGQQLPSR